MSRLDIFNTRCLIAKKVIVRILNMDLHPNMNMNMSEIVINFFSAILLVFLFFLYFLVLIIVIIIILINLLLLTRNSEDESIDLKAISNQKTGKHIQKIPRNSVLLHYQTYIRHKSSRIHRYTINHFIRWHTFNSCQ